MGCMVYKYFLSLGCLSLLLFPLLCRGFMDWSNHACLFAFGVIFTEWGRGRICSSPSHSDMLSFWGEKGCFAVRQGGRRMTQISLINWEFWKSFMDYVGENLYEETPSEATFIWGLRISLHEEMDSWVRSTTFKGSLNSGAASSLLQCLCVPWQDFFSSLLLYDSVLKSRGLKILSDLLLRHKARKLKKKMSRKMYQEFGIWGLGGAA